MAGDSKLAIAGTITLGLAMAGVLLVQQPLKSTRPPSMEAQVAPRLAEGVAQARLWEDPLEAARRDKESNNTSKSGEPNDVDLVRTLRDDLDQRLTKQKGSSITVLLVTTDGGSSGESRESRIRDRYAIASALGVACYVPLQEDQVSYLVWQEGQRKGRVLPYEWYEQGARLCASDHSERASAVLVMWVSSEFLGGHTIDALQELIKSLRGGKVRIDDWGKQVHFKIIGPRSSSSFRALLKEAVDKASKKDTGWINGDGLVELYSPWATAMPKLLTQDITVEPDLSGPIKDEGCAASDPSRTKLCQILFRAGIVLKHSIGSDDQLFMAMTDELERRQVKFGRDIIILIGEWDSFYGRLLPVEFTAAVCHRIAQRPDEYLTPTKTEGLKTIQSKCRTYDKAVDLQIGDPSERSGLGLNVWRYSYLRGLDGEVAGKKKSEGEKANSSKLGKNSLFDREMLERPVGTSQFDYAQRLAFRIERDVAEEANYRQYLKEKGTLESTEESPKPVAAIGILGSDAYDALLMLQAMRERFPGTVFFATDLDSRLVYAEDYQWTRNLVIASHYGLELYHLLQRDVPPFRDSYQTSAYLATLQAVGHVRPLDRCLPKEAQILSNRGPYPIVSPCGYQADLTKDGVWFSTAESPRIFEVGRHGAVDLSVGAVDEGTTLHPVRTDLSYGEIQTSVRLPPSEIISNAARLVCLAGLIAFVMVVTRPAIRQWMRAKWMVILGAAGMLVLAVFFFREEVGSLYLSGMKWILQEHDQGEPFFWLEGVSVWPTEILRVLATLASVVLLVKGWRSLRSNMEEMTKRDEFDTTKGPAQRAGWRRIVDTVRWVLTPCDGSHDLHAGSLWHLYQDAGSTLNRLMRLVILVVVYIVFFMSFSKVLGTEDFSGPCRGLFSCRLDLILAWASYAGLAVLNLFVFDAVLLCRRWIGALAQASEGSPGALQELRKIELIAQRTTIVNRLVRYPFLILLIMVVARNSYFDDWHFPLVMIVGWVINVLLAIAAALLLYRAAEQARQASLTRLNQHILKGLDSGTGNDGNVKLTQQVVKDIEGVSQGAFVPLWQQPVVESSFYGVLAILQYLYLV